MSVRKQSNHLVSVCGSAPEPSGVEQPNHKTNRSSEIWKTSSAQRKQNELRQKVSDWKCVICFWELTFSHGLTNMCCPHTHTHTHTHTQTRAHTRTQFLVVCSGTGCGDERTGAALTWARGCNTSSLSHLIYFNTTSHVERCRNKWKQNKTACWTSESQTQKGAAGLRMWSVGSPPSILLLNIKHDD